ncbi:MAG: DUF996 domain-containing protein [Gammaproteobacteria bacterium]
MDNTTKLLGGWGYIAVLVFGICTSFLGPVGFILWLAGLVILMVAYFRAANEYNRPAIRNDAMIGLILTVVAGLVFMFFIGASIFGLFLHAGTAFSLAAFGGRLIAGLIIMWLLGIVGAWFWFRASAALTEASGQGLFKTGGLLIFIGAIIIIIPILGWLVLFVGQILQTVGFFTTPDRVQVQQVGVAPIMSTAPPPPASPPTV